MADDGQYKPNWKHYHPYDTVWVQNPFDDKIEWDVAEDILPGGIPVKNTYTIDPHAKAELPGGMIATLGVKIMVDRLMQEAGEDVQMWNLEKRAEYEEKIVLRVKSVTPPEAKKGESQAINLTQKETKTTAKETPKTEAPKVEPEFPQLDPELSKATASLPKTAEAKNA